MIAKGRKYARGSIEQLLDMCEEGGLRGDDVLFQRGRPAPEYSGDPIELDRILDYNWNVDLSEEDREGDEMSGDEHSSGLDGGEPEIEGQPHIATYEPGDRTRHEEQEGRASEIVREGRSLPRSAEEGSLSIRRFRRGSKSA